MQIFKEGQLPAYLPIPPGTEEGDFGGDYILIESPHEAVPGLDKVPDYFEIIDGFVLWSCVTNNAGGDVYLVPLQIYRELKGYPVKQKAPEGFEALEAALWVEISSPDELQDMRLWDVATGDLTAIKDANEAWPEVVQWNDKHLVLGAHDTLYVMPASYREHLPNAWFYTKPWEQETIC
jgi:hypothetical protein